MYITLHSWVLHGFLDSVNSLQWMDPRITFPLQPSTYSHPLTPQSCPRLLHKARSHRAKERWAASIKPKARGICNKYQWDKEICEHIHTECFFMVLFSVLRTAPKLGHILKLLLWQSVLFYWLWSTLLCLSHVNDRDTKERAHSSSPPLNHDSTGVFPPWHMPFTQHGKAFLSESLPPWVLRTGLWRHLWDRHIFQNRFCRGEKNTQWWSSCFGCKAGIFL